MGRITQAVRAAAASSEFGPVRRALASEQYVWCMVVLAWASNYQGRPWTADDLVNTAFDATGIMPFPDMENCHKAITDCAHLGLVEGHGLYRISSFGSRYLYWEARQ